MIQIQAFMQHLLCVLLQKKIIQDQYGKSCPCPFSCMSTSVSVRPFLCYPFFILCCFFLYLTEIKLFDVIFRPSNPGNGWISGVDKLTSRPFRSPQQQHIQPLITPNYNRSRHTIEVHGPYIHGGGFPAMNGNNHMKPIIDPQLPIQIDHIQEYNTMGISYPSTFVTEFGVGGVMSSFESMTATLSRDNWSLHGGPNSKPDQCTDGNEFNKKCVGNNTMAQRNYPW